MGPDGARPRLLTARILLRRTESIRASRGTAWGVLHRLTAKARPDLVNNSTRLPERRELTPLCNCCISADRYFSMIERLK